MNHTVTSETPSASKPPVSERKASANRANAQRSTGPRTPAGKARASLNALRHGILAKAAFNLVIEGEERRAEFEAIVAGLAQEYQPRTITEHMMVQQLAGCYWKLAKVWTFETEAAWRTHAGTAMPLEEVAQYEKMHLVRGQTVVVEVVEEQEKLFPQAGLGKPTIPGSVSTGTILRYQGAINAMLFRCLNFLERRRKERSAEQKTSGDAYEELDYINEATAADDPSPEAAEPAVEPSKHAKAAETHKRTQKDAADASVSSSASLRVDITDAVGTQGSARKRRPKIHRTLL